MPYEDRAIVIGIASYPVLGAGDTPLSLKGPVGDAEAVAAWLRDPAGGGLPHDNVDLILSEDPNGPDPTPDRDKIESAMMKLDTLAQQQSRDGRGVTIGRRLYLYMSGHGYSPARQRGCLFVANARERQSYNVHATAWLDWFKDANYFREFVLWMDCCMDRFSFLPAGDPIVPLAPGRYAPGPSFVAFAAQRPMKSAEVLVPSTGQVRGAFTWALLDGLRGAAADANGRVTGRSLADWLRQSVRGRLPDAALADFDISKEPEIISEDAELIFARGVAPSSFAVKLVAPGAPDGSEIRLWTGSPPHPEQSLRVLRGQVTAKLAAGLYHAEMPELGLAASFEVVTERLVTLNPGQAAVDDRPRRKLFLFDFNPPDAAAEIAIVDGRFAPVERAIGHLSTRLPFGIFKVRTRSGRAIDDTIVLLDRDKGQLGAEIALSASPTVAPILGSAASHEYQAHAVAAFATVAEQVRHAADPLYSSITVMARSFSRLPQGAAGIEPWKGLSLVDSSGVEILSVADGEIHRQPRHDPFALATVAVAPGDYFLRSRLEQPPGSTLDGNVVTEQSLVVPRGWSLEVHVLRRVDRDGRVDFRPRVSVQMVRNGQLCCGEQQHQLELARIALGDERPILGPELEQLLLRKYQNPMAGILGGHLLILGEDAGQRFDPSLLNTVVDNLRELVGTEHPDVEALSLRCNDAARRRTRALRSVPMFVRSWRLIVEAARRRPNLVKSRRFDRLVAQSALPPFLIWSIDDSTREAALKTLARAAWGRYERSEVAEEGTPRPQGTAVAGHSPPPAMMSASAGERMLSPGSRKDRQVARERAARLHVPWAAVAQLGNPPPET